MVRFYDPVNEEDLKRIEKILQSSGIEYFLVSVPEKELGGYQIQVAEEDFAHAESLVNRSLQ
ncbi:MAG: hypothetical protein A2X84_12130 [Desulfuromonadaceae bacterium GWC2_58_13]|nr:MAG: hypothetical protein A2X84_12130 [Desulfuromonadaceae bacterium GWC2_58_13]HAD03590.1 hypothetical protein [Desulfuromonas sp.]